MNVPLWVWLTTIAAFVVMLAVDLLVIGRRPHEPGLRESATWVLCYVTLAAAFGVGILLTHGGRYAGEFFAGWVTEYSLSVDNLFIFVIIMARFAVPRAYQQTVLFVGIVLALVLRGVFIALGAAAIARFSWVFYLFGAFLVYTAVQLLRHRGDDAEYEENALLRAARRRLPVTDRYNGTRLTTLVEGRRMVTPMLVVMLAIGTTDLLFALDSIPAIFGLTKEPYLVFTANVFALMGLRQLYFLIGGLLNRLVYLSVGLSVVLGFIGVKLLLEALHTNAVPFLNGGRPVEWAPAVPISVSLAFIGLTLLVTTLASLARTRRDAGTPPPAAPVGGEQHPTDPSPGSRAA